MKKKTLVILLILIIASFAAYSKFSAKKVETKTPSQKIFTVSLGSIEELVTAQGSLEPKDYVDVGTQVSGQLEKLHVEIGDYVKEGDLIAEIDPRVYETQVLANKAKLKSLKAQISEQNANIKLAESKYKRNKRLLETNNVSQETFEEIESEKDVAYSKLESIKAQIEELESNLSESITNLGYTKIYAPMSGIIALKEAKEGQTLNASQSAPTIVQVADLDTMTVIAEVAEADVSRINENMDVYFTTLGMQNRKWYGKVRQIEPSPEIVNEVVLYNVLIDVDNKDRKLMTGMSTQVFFVIGKAENVPMISTDTLTYHIEDKDTDDTTAYKVMVLENGRPVERIINIGLNNRSIAQVVSGLNVGDQVLLADGKTAASGEKSKNKDNMPPPPGFL
ncbi:MAG: efflux RND transporter periplasmic adaptor subunit [Alphaproteobacteria bacterium]